MIFSKDILDRKGLWFEKNEGKSPSVPRDRDWEQPDREVSVTDIPGETGGNTGRRSRSRSLKTPVSGERYVWEIAGVHRVYSGIYSRGAVPDPTSRPPED